MHLIWLYSTVHCIRPLIVGPAHLELWQIPVALVYILNDLAISDLFIFYLLNLCYFFLFKCPIIMHVILNIYQVYCSPAEFNQILLVWWLRSEVLLDTTSESRTDACNPGWWPLHWFLGIIESYNDLILLFLYMCY